MTSPITGIAYARLSAPDLGVMREFLEDFGFIKVHETDQRLYMRGTSDEPFLHVTEKGPAGSIACGYNAESEEVLHDFVRQGKAEAVEEIDEPGGGKRVTLHDPNGFAVEVVWGRDKVEPIPERVKLRPADGSSVRMEPARIKKIAHGVVATPILDETIDWWQDTFKLLPSDEIYVGEHQDRMGLFSRIDRGEEPVDHHILFVLRNREQAGVHHISCEVDDVDEIFVGHGWLQQKGKYDHIRGIGRHALGCQIFDYWMSPYEQMHEHWITTEQANVHSAFNRHRVDAGMAHDHGDKPSERFVKSSAPIVPRAD